MKWGGLSSWCAEWLGWGELSGWVQMNFDDDVEEEPESDGTYFRRRAPDLPKNLSHNDLESLIKLLVTGVLRPILHIVNLHLLSLASL